jgi:cephalosporin hydroxylase
MTPDELRTLCDTALEAGRTLDLDGCCYGDPHWKGPFVAKPYDYYYFLAGLVKLSGSSRILEIGTHYGGAIKAMARGLVAPHQREEARLVTVDVTWLNESGFASYPDTLIVRVHGSASDPVVVETVRRSFDDRPIDLLYIDAIHTYEATVEHIDLYANALSPRFLVLDDIHLNASMERLWTEMCGMLGDAALDVSTASGRGAPGFGVCLLRG